MNGMCIPSVEPTLVDALSRGQSTRWDWSSGDGRLRGSESFVTGGVPQQIQQANIIQINLTMSLENTKEGFSTKDLMPMAKQYLSSLLFKNAYQYQTITHNHADYLSFSPEKVPIAPTDTRQYAKLSIQSLLLGLNPKQYLFVQLLRTLQYNNILICLVSDRITPKSKTRNAILVIVFENKQAASKWTQYNSYLTILRIQDPYRCLDKFTSPFHCVISRPQNVQVKIKYRAGKHPEAIKNEANIRFRQKNYEEALLLYEIGVGTLVESQKKRQRAVFYANSSQCLYEMRLFESALFYAETSISLDRTYVKGLYRKFNCLLELDIKEIPRVIGAISMIGSKAETEQAQLKYTIYMANKSGLYNWMQILQCETPLFGQYLSNKVVLYKQKEEKYFKSHTKLNKFQLILVDKPMICKKAVQQKFGEEYMALTNQIVSYAKYQERFYQKILRLPCQHQMNGEQLKVKKSSCSQELHSNQIHTICLRCLQLEKAITSKNQILGIWQKMHAFKQQCLANCTYMHVRGALVVFALRDIEPGEALSVDFLIWQTCNRKKLMKQKLGMSCQCTFCSFEWDFYEFAADSEFIYQNIILDEGLSSSEFDKVNLHFLWKLIYQGYKERQLMKQYLLLVEKCPVGEYVMNCLWYLRTKVKNDLFDPIKTTLKRIFQQQFKINHSEAVKLIKLVL